MFSKLTNMVKKGEGKVTNLSDLPVTDWLSGYQFTLSRDEKGQDWVYFHNHPANED
jgi:hypothetical protein